MTREQAERELAEVNLHLVPVHHEDRIPTPEYWLVTTTSGHALGKGLTWQAAYAQARNKAPF